MPCSTFLIEKLSFSQLVKKFPIIYGSRRFITTLISAKHLSLSWARSIQSMNSTFHSLKIHLNIIFSAKPGYPKWSLSLRFPHQNRVYNTPFPIRTTCPTHFILLYFITHKILSEHYTSLSSSFCSYLVSLVNTYLLHPNLYIQINVYIHVCVLPSYRKSPIKPTGYHFGTQSPCQ